MVTDFISFSSLTDSSIFFEQKFDQIALHSHLQILQMTHKFEFTCSESQRSARSQNFPNPNEKSESSMAKELY
ncbi:hypothetical protein M8J76_012153 [Diaphorina citri]|nr:hypothetical protein M8J75_012465 [Diaphorina citri]KAI5719583.1 hypothetical protein M8J76_012153 [Diaphorina citri]